MDWKWDDLRLFLSVHEHGSFSAAARALNVAQPTLSRRVAELEASVGETLVVRQTHGVRLTEPGLKLVTSAQRMAEWAHEARMQLAHPGHSPSGKVRIAAVPSIAYVMAPFVASLHRSFPHIQLEIQSSMESRNLGRGEADLDLRLSPPSHPDLQCIDCFSAPLRVQASRTYAAQLKDGYQPDDLDWICWAPPHENQPINQKIRQLVPNIKPAFTSDNFLVQVSACAAGLGAMVMAKYPPGYGYAFDWVDLNINLGADAITTLYLICHKRHLQLQRVEAVIEGIQQEFKVLRERSRQDPAFAAVWNANPAPG